MESDDSEKKEGGLFRARLLEFPRLELKLEIGLQDSPGSRRTLEVSKRTACCCHRALDHAERPVIQVSVRVGEIGVIENVISIRPHRKSQTLLDFEILVNRHVRIEVHRPTEVVARE